MQDTAEDINWMRIFLWVAVAIMYFLLMRHFYPDGQYYFPWAVVHIAGFFWLYSLGKAVLWRSRYYGDHIVCDGISGSIYGTPVYVRDPSMGPTFHWAIFNLGFSLLPPLRGKLATLVVPSDQLLKAGRNYLCLTLVRKKQYEQLPHVVASFLRDNQSDYNLETVYHGKYSRRYTDNSGVEIDLNAQIEAKDKLITNLRKTNEGDFMHYEQIKNLVDKLGGKKNFFKKVLDRMKSEEADE